MPGFRKKVTDDLIKTTSRYNGADRFITLLFDEMKIKGNLFIDLFLYYIYIIFIFYLFIYIYLYFIYS